MTSEHLVKLRVNGNSQEWFDGEVLASIALGDKIKKFRRSKLNKDVDKEIYNKAHNKSHRWILQKKRVL